MNTYNSKLILTSNYLVFLGKRKKEKKKKKWLGCPKENFEIMYGTFITRLNVD
jgi:hypothetical protein